MLGLRSEFRNVEEKQIVKYIRISFNMRSQTHANQKHSETSKAIMDSHNLYNFLVI